MTTSGTCLFLVHRRWPRRRYSPRRATLLWTRGRLGQLFHFLGMPKRAAEDKGPALVKKPRVASSGNGRKAAASKPVEVPEVPRPRVVTTTVSPAMLSDNPPKSGPDPSSIRRRMNPDSLAFRLGPELVKELESLLTPDMTEMPPFSVRQEIQQRFKVDRRNIYDWFHNKGLRVSSSEKRNEQRAEKLKETRSLPNTRIQASVFFV